jgi:hypothetical protein
MCEGKRRLGVWKCFIPVPANNSRFTINIPSRHATLEFKTSSPQVLATLDKTPAMTSLIPLYCLVAYSFAVMIFHMKGAVSFGLFSGAYALTHDKLDQIPQKPLIEEACPLNFIMLDGECQLVTSTISEFSFKPNISATLEETRSTAEQMTDFPWTFWPQCFSDEKVSDAVCLFSDQKFASGRGIFIVTTEPAAHSILQKPAFADPKALERSNQHANPPFEQHEFPGKGRGLVANKTLFRGDQIFASTPLLIVDPDSWKLSTPERLSLLYRGVETLPAASQESFWALLDHFKGDRVDDRINTNNFEVEINGRMHQALMPEIAMVNHDCRPNAAYFWDEETLTHYVHALRTVQPGEEITISYIDSEKNRAMRMTRLELNWGFKCSCSACSAHPELTAESDARLAQIAEMVGNLNNWKESSPATPEMAELVLSLFEQERLYSSMATAYKHAAEVHSSFGNKYEAIRHARLAIEFNILDKGFRDPDVKQMKHMANQPELTWSWKKRVTERKSGCGCAHSQ